MESSCCRVVAEQVAQMEGPEAGWPHLPSLLTPLCFRHLSRATPTSFLNFSLSLCSLCIWPMLAHPLALILDFLSFWKLLPPPWVRVGAVPVGIHSPTLHIFHVMILNPLNHNGLFSNWLH